MSELVNLSGQLQILEETGESQSPPLCSHSRACVTAAGDGLYLFSAPDHVVQVLPQSAEGVVRLPGLAVLLQASTQLLHRGQPTTTQTGHL